jgi:molybdenum cofactor cytidylyltransferase
LGADQAGRESQLLRYDGARDFLVRVQAALAQQTRGLIVGADVAGDKIAGVPPELIDDLAALENVDAVIDEADGARGLPFKAPAAYEPVIASSTTLLVPMLGIAALGAPLDDAHVHRAAIVARLAEASIGDLVTPRVVARVLTHPEGGLKGKPRGARVITLVNQVETGAQADVARAVARLLLDHAGMDAVAIGAVGNAQNPVRETHRRAAAIVLAAGAGVRMEGHVKQLLPWRGKTLIENAIDLAMQSHAHETVVVLGAHADEIQPIVAKTGARSVVNPDWASGQATSIRAGLRALAPEIAAAVFVNADQPFLTHAVVDALIQRYRETDAPIIASVFAGVRGSPVLFDRAHFAGLDMLRGEQGGRALLTKYPVAWVEFDDARLGVDVDTWDEYEHVVTSALALTRLVLSGKEERGLDTCGQ